MKPRFRARILIFGLLLLPSGVWGREPNAEPVAEEEHDQGEGLFELSVHGYGDLQLAVHDFGPDQTGPTGSPAQTRAVLDTARFAVELEGEAPGDVEFEAELEVEHGGVGAALELEYEEFGEYEQEVERGGEVVLEELYLQKGFGEHLDLRMGRFYVAVGLLSQRFRPTDYLASTRPESETVVIPGLWDEIGVAAIHRTSWTELTLQIVSGLDSTGFSSQRWIASGHQQRFELTRATDLALVARADVVRVEDLVAGVSTYFGNTTANRPKPDLSGTWAPLVLADVHATWRRAPVRAQAVLLWGHLSSADTISEANRTLSNNLGVLRTAVAEEALLTWGEIGVDLMHWLGPSGEYRLEPYVRLDYYDTMLKVSGTVFDNPRFERTVLTTGAAFTWRDGVVGKLDWIHRRLGSSVFRNENTFRFSAGFVF